MELNQVTLPTLDLETAIAFYKTLGFVEIVHSPPRYARFECSPGGPSLSLHRVDSLAKGPGGMIYFECSDLDATVQRLQAAGLEFEHEPIDQDWLWREARLKDPDGNSLCLYYAGDNRLNPPWRVGGSEP
jgi:catechol 2,3-dioxygenase-like lactoylglutathione lyase family enzyme